MKVRFLEPARQELDETISYYNTELAGLGEAFLLEVLSAIERTRQYPKAWHPLTEKCPPLPTQAVSLWLDLRGRRSGSAHHRRGKLASAAWLLAQPPYVVERQK